MRKLFLFSLGALPLVCSAALAQDVMSYGLKHLKVMAEDQKVRVLKYAPGKGVKTPVHSHPSSVVYVIKGGKVKYEFPDGSVKNVELKTGDVLLRPPVTHAEEAIDDVDVVLVELKNQ